MVAEDRQSRMIPFKLYVIINIAGQYQLPPDQLAQEVLRGGADILQLRYKGDNLRYFWQWARKICPIAQKAKIPLIINDRVDLALALGAAGVHLGQDDLPLEAARKLLGLHKIIGVSCHSLKQALTAQAAGADYVGMGPIFPTISKKDAKTPLGFSLIEQFNRQLSIPWVAIGGINLDNCPRLIEAGAKRIAVISAISQAKNAYLATQKLTKFI
jgi:thiamine-phosphate pyrophosphorylase